MTDDTQTAERLDGGALLTRFAGLAPTTYDATTRSVDAVLSSGAAVMRWGYIEELEISAAAVDLGRAQSGLVCLLNAHNHYELEAVLGIVRDCRIEGGNLVGRLYFSDTDDGKKYEGMVVRRELKGVSIGYRALTIETTRAEGEKPEVRRLTRWELMEVSLVPIPADPDSGVRSAIIENPEPVGNRAAITKENTMSNNAPGGAAAPAPETVTAPAPAAPAVQEQRSAPVEPAPFVNRFSPSEALSFVETARSFGDTVATRAAELVAQNERGEISSETARSTLLAAASEAQRAQTGGINGGHPNTAITITADARDKWLRGAQNSILQRAGLAGIVAKAAKSRGETIDLDPGEFRGVRNTELAAWALEMEGAQVEGRDRRQIVGQALVRSAGMQTTSLFPLLLENTMHKVLQASYGITPDTWSRFCGKGSVSDFRAHPRYLRGALSSLDSLNETGEFKNKPIADAVKETITATTKGNIIALTRQAIVDDDLGAFNNLAMEFGRAAKLTIEEAVYALITANSGLGTAMSDGSTLFHANHSNIAASAAAPSVAAFDAIRVLMASQMDVNSEEFLDIRPAIWLGPVALGGNARVINDAVYDPDTANKLQKPNMVNGLFSDIVDTPRLSGTRWYAFADPMFAPAIEVAFLDGVEEPVLEMQDGWRVDGTEWKVKIDFGVAPLNWRSAATNAGA